ncbi:MAG: insulinase family protein [Myxococcales bacterium]|nr:insulinase family protein [Myxococcales bacterium]
MDPIQYQLPNGMSVILQQDHTAPVVAVQVWVNVGSADETAAQAGLAHVHEHMLFKGTERRAVGEIAAEVEGAGGQINAWTSYDQTVYHIVIASRYAATALDVLADATLHSTFDGEELSRELEVIQEELKRGEDQPSHVLSDNLFRTAFQSHPYGLPIIGTEESVASFTREDVLNFFNTWYRPDNMTVVVVGDFDLGEMRDLIAASFGDQVNGATARHSRPVEPVQAETRVSVVYQDIEEGHMALAFHVPGLSHSDVPALELLSILLGQGDSSILFEELQRNRQLVTDTYAYLYTPREPGILDVSASFQTQDDPVDPMDVLDATLEQLFRLHHVAVSERDLRRAKVMLQSETVYRRETVQGRANRLGYFHVVAGDIAFEERFFELAAMVTPEELTRVARQYLTPENMTVAFVLPESMRGTLEDDRVVALARQEFQEIAALSQQDALIPDSHGIVIHDFPGGLRVIIQEDQTVPLVAVRAVVSGGLRLETEQTNGINNLVAELLTEGTASRSAQEIAQEIESMAGSISGFSGRNSIGLEMQVLSQEFDAAFELFADCLQNASFPEREVDRIRRELLAELAARADDLAGTAFRQLNRAIFRGHPLQYDVLGTTESINSLALDDIRDYYHETLDPSRMTIAVVGDVRAREVISAVERNLDVVSEGTSEDPDLSSLSVPQRQEIVSNRERQQAHIAMGYLTVPMDHPDRYPLEVLAAILSGQGGRLFVQLRDRQSLAYSVAAFNVQALDAGYFAAYIATSPGKQSEAIESIERELQLMRDELVSRDELERAQRYLVGSRAISMQRSTNRAAFLAFDDAYGIGYDDHYRYDDHILAVTPEEIQRVARQYLSSEHVILSIVRPSSTEGSQEASQEE